jgi:outer membrane beta-barrel protein
MRALGLRLKSYSRLSCAAFCALLIVAPGVSLAQDAPEQPPDIDLGGEGEGEDDPALPGVEPEPPPPTDDILTPKKSDLSTTSSSSPDRSRDAAIRKKGWKDIVVLPRKPYLKRGRVELTPFVGSTLNDTLIQHTALGLDVTYFLTDVLGIGLEAMYYFDNVTDNEFLIRYHFRRVPTINRYRYSASGNFSYVPIYGKFSIMNKLIAHYDVWLSGGVGITGSEVIPRDFNHESFSNISLTFPIAIGARFFITRWMALQVSLRDYMLLDKFESPGRDEVNGDLAKENQSETRFVNNLIFTGGLSFYLPFDFEYSTYR